MDMRHDNSLRSNLVYQGRIAEEEAKLRWLITRQPRSRELVYYLIFLLAANGQHTKVLVECRRVLEAHPEDVVARMWRELIHLRWRRSPHRLMSSRQFARNRHRRRDPRRTG